MYSRIIKIAALLLVGLLSSTNALADKAHARCKTYHWKPGDIISVTGQLNKTSSVKLPEQAFDVVWGAKDLWDSDFVKNLVFIKPLTPKSAGLATTFTVVGQSGNTYEFYVRRVKHMSSHCTIVKADSALINQAKWQQLGSQETANVKAMQDQIKRLQIENAMSRQTVANESKRKAKEAIKVYQSAINSNYQWNKGSGWTAASGAVVASVHDDGRFTYVKLKSDARGLLSVLAEIEGKQEILEAKYIPETKTYKISGIFPRFKLRAGSTELEIMRRGA